MTIRLDTHTHCDHSPDSETPVAQQARAIAALGLDVVCATDRNTIEDGLRLREIARGFRVVIGEEVSSREGEIIGLFLERPIPPERSAEETIGLVHEQGGLVCIPHPFSHNRPAHLRRETLDRLWPQVDAIEIFNARESVAGDNRKAAELRASATSRARSVATRTASPTSAAPGSTARTSAGRTTSSRRSAPGRSGGRPAGGGRGSAGPRERGNELLPRSVCCLASACLALSLDNSLSADDLFLGRPPPGVSHRCDVLVTP